MERKDQPQSEFKKFDGVPSKTLAKRFFAPAPRGPLRQALSAALDGRKNRAGRRSSDTCHRFPHVVRTNQSHSQSIACWPFLSRNSRLHLLNFSFQRLRSELTFEKATLRHRYTPTRTSANRVTGPLRLYHPHCNRRRRPRGPI